MTESGTPGGLRERVEAAYYKLPEEGRSKKRPSYRALEQRYKLPGGIFSRVLSGATEEITLRNAEKLATALNVSVSWLITGTAETVGPPSMPTRSPDIAGSPNAPAEGPEAARDLAATWARWEGVDPRAIDMVRAGPLYPYSPRVWHALILVFEANLKIAEHKP